MTAVDTHLENDLRERLLALNYHAFLQAVVPLLIRMGYENPALSGRTGWVGRNRDGGFDLMAHLPVPGGARRVIVQAKQYGAERPIYRRTIDELRGVALRAQAAEALLITTSQFSPSVDLHRYASTAIAPVRLIDGAELVRLMMKHKVGVRSSRREGTAADARFFKALETRFAGVARPADEDRVVVTLRFASSPRRGSKKAALPRRS
jgi:restriction endonuclease Mrr